MGKGLLLTHNGAAIVCIYIWGTYFECGREVWSETLGNCAHSLMSGVCVCVAVIYSRLYEAKVEQSKSYARKWDRNLSLCESRGIWFQTIWNKWNFTINCHCMDLIWAIYMNYVFYLTGRYLNICINLTLLNAGNRFPLVSTIQWQTFHCSLKSVGRLNCAS